MSGESDRKSERDGFHLSAIVHWRTVEKSMILEDCTELTLLKQQQQQQN